MITPAVRDQQRKNRRRARPCAVLACVVALLAGCGTSGATRPKGEQAQSVQGQEVVIHAISLLDRGYRFGGKNPEAGIDCSGMVSYVYRQAASLELAGSAADIARRGRPIALAEARPGDLVFFNTRGGRYTHVGIYIGDGRFVHAPSSASGKVRISRLDESYFAKRFTEARAYLD